MIGLRRNTRRPRFCRRVEPSDVPAQRPGCLDRPAARCSYRDPTALAASGPRNLASTCRHHEHSKTAHESPGDRETACITVTDIGLLRSGDSLYREFLWVPLEFHENGKYYSSSVGMETAWECLNRYICSFSPRTS